MRDPSGEMGAQKEEQVISHWLDPIQNWRGKNEGVSSVNRPSNTGPGGREVNSAKPVGGEILAGNDLVPVWAATDTDAGRRRRRRHVGGMNVFVRL